MVRDSVRVQTTVVKMRGNGFLSQSPVVIKDNTAMRGVPPAV